LENNEIPDVRFLGVKISNIDYREIYQNIRHNIDMAPYICLTNVTTVIWASADRELLEAINGSLISVPDGMPLVWYGRIVGCQNIARVPGPELMSRLLAERDGFKHFLLGDTEETIEKVKEKARKVNKKIIVSGYNPPFKDEFSEADNIDIFDRIYEKEPDIIWVSFGGGKQDKWMHRNRHRLKRGVMIGVGAAFRFYIGEIKAPPKIFQDMGLQWLFRMVSTPGTIRPMLRTFPKFIFHFPREVIAARKTPII